MEIVRERLQETLGMLPVLHAPTGKLTVAAAGPMAEQLTAEMLRWRDVEKAYLMAPPRAIKDRRVEVAAPFPRGKVHVMVLSPEQAPDPWLPMLAKDGIIIASTTHTDKWEGLRRSLSNYTGSATPFRNWLPTPIYGVLAKSGQGKVSRNRQPPKGARHLSPQYLPSLFTFSKDELPFNRSNP